MIVNFDSKLYGLNKEPAKIGQECPFCQQPDPRGNEDLTLSHIAVTSLLMQGREETPDEKRKKYKLLMKVNAGGKVNLEAEDQTALKDVISKGPFNSLFTGQCEDLIEGRRPFCAPEPQPSANGKPKKKGKTAESEEEVVELGAAAE